MLGSKWFKKYCQTATLQIAKKEIKRLEMLLADLQELWSDSYGNQLLRENHALRKEIYTLNEMKKNKIRYSKLKIVK